MTPRKETLAEGVDLWLGDCREILPSLGKVDAVVTDPPYDERTHSRARSLKNGGSDIAIDFSALSDFSHVELLLQASKGWVLAFCSVEQLGAYQLAAGAERWMRAAIWDRPDGTPQISGDRPGQGAEGIAVMHSRSTKPVWQGGGERGLWRCPRNKEDVGHPTAKPEDLMKRLVRLFTRPGETILDPFAGSGTTGVAAIKLGRSFIGIEKHPPYFEIMLRRISEALKQPDMFIERPAPAKQEVLGI